MEKTACRIIQYTVIGRNCLLGGKQFTLNGQPIKPLISIVILKMFKSICYTYNTHQLHVFMWPRKEMAGTHSIASKQSTLGYTREGSLICMVNVWGKSGANPQLQSNSYMEG